MRTDGDWNLFLVRFSRLNGCDCRTENYWGRVLLHPPLSLLRLCFIFFSEHFVLANDRQAAKVGNKE